MSYSCCIIRLTNNKIESEYLAHVLRSERIAKQIYFETQSIGVPDLGLDKILAFKIPIPKDKSKSESISKILTSIDTRIESEQSNLNKLLKMKTGLMQDLLTGKVRVKVAA
jgi:type I restriction enzyme S subunit